MSQNEKQPSSADNLEQMPEDPADDHVASDPDREDYEEAGNRAFDPYGVLASDNTEETPQTPEAQAQRGEEQMSHGQIREALDSYRQAVRAAGEDNDSGSAHRVLLGDAYAYSGQALNAFRQYRRAIKIAPRKAEPHFSLAELYQRYGRLRSAVTEYRKAITYAPTNAYYRYKLGDALAQTGDLEGAVSELEEASHLKPQDGFYHFWLGDLYSRAGRLDEAVREMQQATLFSPYDAYYNIRLGALYRRSDMLEDAAAAIRHALSISPTNGAYHCLLADIYSEMHQESHAIYHYQMAGHLDDYDLETLRRLRRLSGMDDSAMLALDSE